LTVNRGFSFFNQKTKAKNTMNQLKKLPARFQPEARRELWPAPAVPFRAGLETEFERLKTGLLAEQLAATQAELAVPLLRRAANEAAALAWVSRYPLLVFPALFAEKARVAERQARRQSRIYAATQELVLAA
jgi:hypothetical protein